LWWNDNDNVYEWKGEDIINTHKTNFAYDVKRVAIDKSGDVYALAYAHGETYTLYILKMTVNAGGFVQWYKQTGLPVYSHFDLASARNGKIYLSINKDIFVFDDDVATPTKVTTNEEQIIAMSVGTFDESIWVLTPKYVKRWFDSTTGWITYLHP
jgi:hypothetical protein